MTALARHVEEKLAEILSPRSPGVRHVVTFPRLIGVLVFLLSLGGAHLAQAQTISAPATITYTTPTVTDYNNGYGPTYRVTVTTASFGNGNNGLYQAQIRASASALGNGKSIGDIQFMRPCGTGGPATGCGVWKTLSTTYQNILTTWDANLTWYIDFQITNWDWALDTPYTYQVTLDFHAYNNAGGKNAYTYPVFQVVVDPVAALSLAPNSITYSAPTSANFTTGSLQSAIQSAVTVKANSTYRVGLRGTSTSFSSTNGSASIPASDLQWSTNGTTWSGLNTTGSTISTVSPGTSSLTVMYRNVLNWSRSIPGTHSLGFEYSLTAN